ncbi:MAG: SOS response-associated peptidase [Chloroflexi bacterium]|nr:SOS response-associated peptidase [Chloroflexota bacterium]
MCGRYTLTTPEELAERFGIAGLSEVRIEPRFNVAPSQSVPVIVGHDGGPALVSMRWGFQPSWMKETGQRPPPINARAETLLERPMFRGAVAHGRCLIPANGFYEWMAVPGKKTKQPVYVRLKDGGLFAFAGLHTRGREDVGETCVIVTTAANALLQPVHDRMPVILSRSVEELWLDPSLDDARAAMAGLQLVEQDRLEVYPVSTLVSNVRNDGPSLLEPLEDAPAGVPRLF